MTRFNKKNIFVPALVALSVCAACAAETDGGGDGVDSGSGGAPTVGSGGASTGSGGAPITGSGGAPITGSGGAPITGSGGGGTTAPNPTLTPSNFAVEGYGTSDPWSGYVFTGAWDGAVINPPCGTAGPCFTGPNVCAAGSIPGSYEAGAMIGFNVNQAEGATLVDTWAMTGSGVIVDVERAPASARIQIKAGGASYCATLTDGVAVAWDTFKTECWGTTGTALPAGSAISAIEVVLPGAETAQTFDFCVIDVKLAP